MKVRMILPLESLKLAAGETVELNDIMAQNLIVNGYAEAVKTPAKKETKNV